MSHASLSANERRRSEAFAEARDGVIVSTSTLELDVGDLDAATILNTPVRFVASSQ